MTWFKVDDSFASHPKVAELEDGPCFAQAVALWTLAGSWCASHLTDGAVPRAQLRKLVPFAATRAASELVRVGLWIETETGYSFHDWTKYQPCRADVLAEREKSAERVRAWRDKSRTNGGGNGSGNAVTGDVTNGERTHVSNGAPDPTRPDPTRPSPSGDVVRACATAAAPTTEPTAPTPPHPPPHVEAFERSLRGPTDAVVAAVSETRQAAGGAKFRPVSWQDREAVQKLAEWVKATEIPPKSLRAALAAFWGSKGTSARLSWFVEEDPGRFLGAKPTKRGGSPEFRPCPPPESFALDAEGKARNRAELIAMGFTTEELEAFRDIA